MPQVFITSAQVPGSACVITGDDFHHLARVRRVKVDDIIDLRDGSGALLKARVTAIGPSSLEAVVLDKEEQETVPVAINLCAAVLKGKKFDFVIQKAAELGVAAITPLVSRRCVPDLEDKGPRKHERWSRIAAEAAKQCMRREVPRVNDIVHFNDLVSREIPGLRIMAHPGSPARCRSYLESVKGESAVNLLIGPEGGFSAEEIDLALRNGWTALNFGFTSLRAETAAIVVPSIILYQWGR